MCAFHDFQESYYDHRCLIVPEKDVLEIDIPGGGFVVYLKRWWNDLFLLSCNDRRSRIYFTSSRNMSMERFKQYRQYRNRIHPLSKFRNFWDCLTMNVFILEKIVFHHNTSLIFEKVFHMFFYYVAILLEIIVIADLFVNFETGYIHKPTKRIILNTQAGICKYCSTKLFIHCVSAIPLQCLMFLRLGGDIDSALSKANYFVCVLRIINMFSLYRIYESTKYWTRAREPSAVMYFFKFLRIGVMAFISMLLLFDLSDTICLLTTMWTGYVDKKAFYNYLLFLKVAVKGEPSKVNLVLFCFNMGRICKSLFMFGHMYSYYYLDMMTTLLAYFIANIFYMWCLLECYGFMIRRKYQADHMNISKTLTLNLAKNRQLPDQVCHRISEYYDLKMTALRGVEKCNELYNCLPAVLKRNAKLHCHSKRITRLPFFSGWPMDILDQIVLLLKDAVYLTDDIVAEPSVCGDGLVIVDEGEAVVYSASGKETGHLIDGDYYGELSLVTDKELRTSCVVAATCCKILLLEKTMFRILMREHAQLFYKLRRQILEKYQFKKRREKS